MSFLDNTGLSYFYSKLKEKFIRSVNSQIPDVTGNVDITNVATADNLTSPDAQASYDYFIYRTSGGSASLTSGEAELLYIDGNMEINGRVAENFNIIATNNISVTYNASQWRQQISSSGTYIFNYVKPNSSSATTSWTDSGTWNYGTTPVSSLNGYGLYASNIIDPNVAISVSGSGIASATIIPSTWSGQISSSGTYNFIYEQPEEGSANWYLEGVVKNLSTYGIAVNGTAQLGDIINVVYVSGTPNSTITVNYTAPEQGTITIATPTSFSATGFNQFDKETMYIANAAISNGVITSNSGTYVCYCKAVGGVTGGYGAYSSSGVISNIGWCAELPVIGSSIVTSSSTVTSTLSSVEFNDNGYVVVVVSSMDDLMIHPRWSGSADTAEYTAYVAPSVITLPTEDLEQVAIPIGDYGMPAVGAIADRLNLDAGTYIQRIGRLANTTQNMNYVQGLNVAYEYDASWIYYVLPNAVTYFVDIDPVYIVNDWGTEEFIGTSIAVGAQTLYGQNLRDKLRTDVLTISQQQPALTQTQKAQVLNNIGAVSASDVKYQIYNSVTGLRLTSGSATISRAYTALPDSSILICDASEFTSTEIPNTLGVIEIVKCALAKSYIHFYGKASDNKDYRMFLNSGNTPTGTWEPIRTELDVTREIVLQNKTTSAGGKENGIYSLSRSGYTPIGIVGWYFNGNRSDQIRLVQCIINSTKTGLVYWVRNDSNAASTGYELEVDILWKKD